VSATTATIYCLHFGRLREVFKLLEHRDVRDCDVYFSVQGKSGISVMMRIAS
jgi:hypothetical protein